MRTRFHCSCNDGTFRRSASSLCNHNTYTFQHVMGCDVIQIYHAVKNFPLSFAILPFGYKLVIIASTLLEMPSSFQYSVPLSGNRINGYFVTPNSITVMWYSIHSLVKYSVVAIFFILPSRLELSRKSIVEHSSPLSANGSPYCGSQVISNVVEYSIPL